MRTTLDIDPDLLEKLLQETGERSRGKAVDRAIDAYLKRAAIEKLLAARGTFNVKRTHAAWEAAEMKAMKHGHPRR